MEPTNEHHDENSRPREGAADIEAAVQRIREEIDRRADHAEHPLGRYQVVCSGDRGRIWIASAVGPCLDSRFTPLEIGPEQAWTWHCEDPEDDACDVGWQVSTPAEIVDLLADVLGCA